MSKDSVTLRFIAELALKPTATLEYGSTLKDDDLILVVPHRKVRSAHDLHSIETMFF